MEFLVWFDSHMHSWMSLESWREWVTDRQKSLSSASGIKNLSSSCVLACVVCVCKHHIQYHGMTNVLVNLNISTNFLPTCVKLTEITKKQRMAVSNDDGKHQILYAFVCVCACVRAVRDDKRNRFLFWKYWILKLYRNDNSNKIIAAPPSPPRTMLQNWLKCGVFYERVHMLFIWKFQLNLIALLW